MNPGDQMILVTAAGNQDVTVVSLRLMGRVEVKNAQGERVIVKRAMLKKDAS